MQKQSPDRRWPSEGQTELGSVPAAGSECLSCLYCQPLLLLKLLVHILKEDSTKKGGCTRKGAITRNKPCCLSAEAFPTFMTLEAQDLCDLTSARHVLLSCCSQDASLGTGAGGGGQERRCASKTSQAEFLGEAEGRGCARSPP